MRSRSKSKNEKRIDIETTADQKDSLNNPKKKLNRKRTLSGTVSRNDKGEVLEFNTRHISPMHKVGRRGFTQSGTIAVTKQKRRVEISSAIFSPSESRDDSATTGRKKKRNRDSSKKDKRRNRDSSKKVGRRKKRHSKQYSMNKSGKKKKKNNRRNTVHVMSKVKKDKSTMRKVSSEPDFTVARRKKINQMKIISSLKRGEKRKSKILLKKDIITITPIPKVIHDDSCEEDDQYKKDMLCNVIYDVNQQVIVAGRVDELILALIKVNVDDSEYMNILLSTHMTFTDSNYLMTQLINYFNDPPTESESEREVIMIRIIEIFKTWLNSKHLPISEELSALLETFMESVEVDDFNQKLRKAWANRYSEQDESNHIFPPSIMSYDSETVLIFTKISPIELARQFAIFYSDLFRQISIEDICGLKHESIQSLIDLESWSSKVRIWVTCQVLNTENFKRRVEVITHLTELLWHSLEYCNYQGAIDIFLGLDHFLVTKLKKSWKSLDKPTLDMWKDINQMLDPSGSWKGLRKGFSECKTACTFPIAIINRDLITLEENSNKWNGHVKIVNFAKRRLLAKTISQIAKIQQPYNFYEVDMLQSYIKNLATMSESHLEAVANKKKTDELKKKNKGSKKALWKN